MLSRLTKPLLLTLAHLSAPEAPAAWEECVSCEEPLKETSNWMLRVALVDAQLANHTVTLRPAAGAYSLLARMSCPWPPERMLQTGGVDVCAVLAGWRLQQQWEHRSRAVAVVSHAVAAGEAFPHCFVEWLLVLCSTQEGAVALAEGDGLLLVQALAQLCQKQAVLSAMRALTLLLSEASPRVTERLDYTLAAKVLAGLLRQCSEFDEHEARWLTKALAASVGSSCQAPRRAWCTLVSSGLELSEVLHSLSRLCSAADDAIRADATLVLAALCAQLSPEQVDPLLALCADSAAMVRVAAAAGVQLLCARPELHCKLLSRRTKLSRGLEMQTRAKGLLHSWAQWVKPQPAVPVLPAAPPGWDGAVSIVQLAGDLRAQPAVLEGVLLLAQHPEHHSALAEAQVITLCGQLALQPRGHAPVAVQLLALQCLAQLAQSTEHRMQVLQALQGLGCVVVQAREAAVMAQMLQLAADLMMVSRSRLVGDLSALRELLQLEVRPIAAWAFATNDTPLQLLSLRCLCTLGAPLQWSHELQLQGCPVRTAPQWVHTVWLLCCIERLQRGSPSSSKFSWGGPGLLQPPAMERHCARNLATSALAESYDTGK